MSKRCSKCGATNFESATICVNCGSLFKDGAYSPNVTKTRKFKMPYKEVISLEKSSKAIVAAIVSIVVILIIITVACIISFSGSKKTDDAFDNPDTAEIVQQADAVADADSQDAKNAAGVRTGSNGGGSGSESGADGEYARTITAAEKNVEMKIGEVKELSVSLFPENSESKYVTWCSNNTGVVRLVKETKDLVCNIEAVGEGTATITVETVGSGLGTISETITVTVVDANKLVEPDSIADYGDYYVTANSYLSLRTGPEATYSEILRMKKDEIVRVYAKQTNDKGDVWFYVNYNGTEGWALGRFLEEYHYEEYEDYDYYE